MKSIYLIGDSIRMGYDSIVKEKLASHTAVYYTAIDGMFTQNMLRYLHEWVSDFGIDGKKIDVVHWNTGLEDVTRILDSEPLTSPGFYEYMLKRLYQRISNIFPNAELIFALSTKVSEQMNRSPHEVARLNRDIEQYNLIAENLMIELGVRINNLYDVSASIQKFHSDFTNYTYEGNVILADAVIEAISQYL